MAINRMVSLPDMAMPIDKDDLSESPYTEKLHTALRNANPGLADKLIAARKRSHNTAPQSSLRCERCAAPRPE